MGKLFHRKNRYSDEEFENEEYENDDELEEEELMDSESDDEFNDSDENFEDDEPDSEESDDDDEDLEEDDGSEEEEDDEDEDDEEYDEEEERRMYRRRRRIRNQIISYSVVFLFLAAITAGGVVIGRNIAEIIQARKLAEKQEEMEAEIEADEAHDVVIDAPEPIEEETEEDLLGPIVDSYMSTMPLEDKVAGLFIVTPEALTGVSTAIQAGDGTQKALEEYKVGGLIYFDKNIVDKEQLTTMLSNTVSMSSYPIFLAVDEEGGSVSRVAGSSIEVIQVDDMAAIGAGGDTAQAYETGLTIGGYLKELGFNVNFAPVADVAGAGESAMGDRVFGSDPAAVGDMVANVVEGIEGTGVSSCLKHFPGIGSAQEDTHDGRVETTKTLEEMRNSDFIPFKAGIEAGADFVMVSHIVAPAVDENAEPSTLSKTIMTDVLRNELGFQGIIITDALNMSAITDYYTSEDAAVKAIEAGADMLLMPDDFQAAYDAVLAAVQDGTISEERIDESLERIYRVKCAEKLAE